MFSDKTKTAVNTDERRSAMFGTLHKIFETFTSYGKDNITLDNFLSDVALLVSDAVGIDLLSFFREDEEETLRFKQIYRWIKTEGEAPVIDKAPYAILKNSVTESWFSALAANECVCLLRSELSADEIMLVGRSRFRTKLIVPVFSSGRLWGAVSFDDFTKECRMDEDEIAFLHSVAALCANIVIQDEKTQTAAETFEDYKRENETSLETLKTILNSFDGIILATVPETGEILYINEKNKAFFGVEGDGKGRFCYEFLHGRSERCDYCPYYEIEKEPGKSVQWEPSDPHIDTVYRMTALLIDWPGGKKAHLEFGIDITEVRRSQEILINILSSLDAHILATVPETGEILFINDKSAKFFGAEGDGTGKICHEFLFGKTERCDHCAYDRLIKEPDKVIQWETYYPDKDCMHSMTTLLINWSGGRKAQLDFGVDISERRRVQKALERREKMLDMLNRAAIILLSKNEKTFEKVMTEGVGLIAGITNIDRMSISRNIQKQDGLYASQIYRWSREVGTAVETRSELQVNSYDRHIPRWRDILAAGECINGPVCFMPECEVLKYFGCLSVLAIPVFNEGEFWGFVLWENHMEEREFTADEVDILRSASFMLANVVIRDEEAEKIREADEHAALMLESMPYACTLLNQNYEVFDCNDALIKLFRLDSRKQFLNDPYIISPQFQPDGNLSTEEGAAHIREAFEKGYRNFSWMHITIDGEEIPTESIFVRGVYKGEYILVGYIRDVRQYITMQREIEKRSILLNALNQMSTILLQTDVNSFEDDLLRAMGVMAETINVDRTVIWRNHKRDGQRQYVEPYVWAERAQGCRTVILPDEISYDDESGFTQIFLEKRCINGPIRSMPAAMQELLASQEVVSVLIVPIFLKDDFWGTISFEDCHNERVFSESEENILCSTSELIADALNRNEMEESLRAGAIRLEHALAGAQSANRAKSEFLSRMSHEMRTPMNAIIGMTSIGKSSQTKGKKDYAFNKIEDASNHLLGVINDVLDMSKIEANKLELASHDFIFESMLQKVVSVINFRVNERRQRLHVDIDNNIPDSLLGDEQRLAQVVANLLSNAVKFTPDEGIINLAAKLESEQDGFCRIEISVADNGIGLTNEQMERIFKSFEQAGTDTARTYGGTGLGLSISKRIVELMGGEIWVESESARGAKFTFTVLLRRGRKVQKRLLEKGINQKEISILAVDDDKEIRAFFLSAAADLGIGCKVAESAEKAVGMIAGHNIFFINWKLPGINGIEFTRLIHEKTKSDAIVLLFSENDWNVIEEDARAAGIDRFLQKPLFQSDIVDAINEVLVPKNMKEQFTINDDFSGHTVLLAEDMEINREIVLTLLEPTNLTIACAKDGAEALHMFEEAPDLYEVILMDVQMPVMDGYEATRRIRAMQTSHAKEVPIIAMTANVFREDIERCLDAGMNEHLGKPFLIKEVLAVLRKYI